MSSYVKDQHIHYRASKHALDQHVSQMCIIHAFTAVISVELENKCGTLNYDLSTYHKLMITRQRMLCICIFYVGLYDYLQESSEEASFLFPICDVAEFQGADTL